MNRRTMRRITLMRAASPSPVRPELVEGSSFLSSPSTHRRALIDHPAAQAALMIIAALLAITGSSL